VAARRPSSKPAAEPTQTSEPTPSATPTAVTEPTAEPTAATKPAPVTKPAAKPPSESPHAESITVRIYLARGEKLAVVSRSFPKTEAVAAAAVRELLDGPRRAEKRAGYGTLIPAKTRLRSVAIKNGTATVDLTSGFESGGGSLSMRMRVAQVVYTLTQFPSVKRVAFKLDGKPVEAIGGEGVVVSPPVKRADFTDDILPLIFVESPTRGQRVHSPFRLSGISNTFEATYLYELLDSHGKVVSKGRGMATSGTGTWGTFEKTVRFKNAASGKGKLIVYEASPKDGSRINVATIPVVLVP